MDTPEGLRNRLMALLALYDLLPYSLSNPPHGAPPMTLDEAIGPDAVRRCLEAMSRTQPQSLPGELSNILRGSRNANTGHTRGSGNSGNSRSYQCSTYPASNLNRASHLRG